MTLSPYKKYMAVPRKYQLSDFVNRKLRALLGTSMMPITSLKEMICMAEMRIMMYIWPESRAATKPETMTKVHIVRVMKVCFFFSNSEGSGGA